MSRFPSRGRVEREINSIFVGSLSEAFRSTVRWTECDSFKVQFGLKWVYIPSLASSSRIGTPPISKMTQPIGTLFD